MTLNYSTVHIPIYNYYRIYIFFPKHFSFKDVLYLEVEWERVNFQKGMNTICSL